MLRRRSQRFKDACQTRDWWARGQRGRSRGTPRSFAQQKDVSFRMTSAESDSGAPSLFGLAPCGVCHARGITVAAVRSYRTFSPLPWRRCRDFVGRALLPASAHKSVRATQAPHKALTTTPRRYVFCGAFRPPDLNLASRTLSGTLLCGVRTFLPAHSRKSRRCDALARMGGAAVRSGCLREHYMRRPEIGPQTSDLRLQTSDFGPQTSDLRLRTSDLRPQTSDFRPQTSDLRLQTSDFGPRISDFRPQTSDLRPQTSDLRLQTSDFRLQASGPPTLEPDVDESRNTLFGDH